MNRGELIDVILRLSPGTIEQHDRSRALLSGMGEPELTSMYRDLSVLHQAGTETMQRMSPAARDRFAGGDRRLADRLRRRIASIDKPAPGTVPEVAEGALAIQTARHDIRTRVADLGQLRRSVARWAGQTRIGDADRVNAVVHGATQDQHWHHLLSRVGSAPRLADMLEFKERLERVRRTLTGPLGHELVWSDVQELDPHQTVDAIARLENELQERQPDLLVAMNDGGDAVCRLIAADLSIPAPITVVRGAARGGLTWHDDGCRVAHPKTVYVIGHVAWSGSTIESVVAETRKRFGASVVSVAVLASSALAVERVSKTARFTFHCVTPGAKVQLRIYPRACEHVGTVYSLSEAAGGGGTISISSQELRVARAAMMQAFGP